MKDNCPEDEMRDIFEIPDFVNTMMENKCWEAKHKQGFYKRVVGEGGKKEILSLDLNTLEYRPKQRAKFATLELTKTIDNVIDRFPDVGWWKR